jgi:hypothetical protein
MRQQSATVKAAWYLVFGTALIGAVFVAIVATGDNLAVGVRGLAVVIGLLAVGTAVALNDLEQRLTNLEDWIHGEGRWRERQGEHTGLRERVQLLEARTGDLRRDWAYARIEIRELARSPSLDDWDEDDSDEATPSMSK